MAEPEEEEIRTVTISPYASARVIAVIAVAFFIAATLAFLLTGGGQEVLHRSVIVRTYFADGTGLVRTADVQLNGIKVGEVKAVVLTDSTEPARAIEVRMNIQKNFLGAIPDDSLTEITADNLVGDKYINIRKGRSSRTISPGDELRTSPPTANFDPGDLLASISVILKRASDLLDQIENPSAPLGSLVKGEDLYDQIRDDIIAVQTAIHKYDNPKGPFGKAIYGQDLYNQLRKPMLDIDKMLADMQNGRGQYGDLLKNSGQYDNLVASIRGFHKSVADMRASSMMSNDEQYRSAEAMLRNLNSTFDSLTTGEGQLAQLLTSSQLYEMLNGSSRDARAFVKDFRENPRKYLRIKVF
ncbi:MAG: MlaD family protein [Acidobacteriota bacterium]|nr:MlaD family protein [Acidobacteriota bacterium]